MSSVADLEGLADLEDLVERGLAEVSSHCHKPASIDIGKHVASPSHPDH
jgi:hypothetical protein